MKHKFITIGEIMLRLTPPDYEKIRTATSFEARYGGSEANVALSLANLGVDASFFTVVPGNSLGKSAVRMMRSNDVNCDSVIYSTEEETPAHRLGTYYLETGYGIRPSKVVYDRKHSAFSEYDFSKTDVKKLLEAMEEDIPYTANEILELLHLKSKDALRKNYLNPALESGQIQMTIPNAPKSKNQRYVKSSCEKK